MFVLTTGRGTGRHSTARFRPRPVVSFSVAVEDKTSDTKPLYWQIVWYDKTICEINGEPLDYQNNIKDMKNDQRFL